MKLTDDELSALIHTCQAADEHGSHGSAMRKLLKEEAARAERVPPGVYTPDVAIPPGETIKEMMEARGITTSELAVRLGFEQGTVENIIQGRLEISDNTALVLSQVFHYPRSFWLGLQSNHRRNLERLKEKDGD